MEAASSTVASQRPWLVLVAGEHWKNTTGERRLGQHCSLRFIGRAYESLVDFFGRDRVIVIAQLKQVLEWLRKAAETGQPAWTTGISDDESRSRWSSLLADYETDCRRLNEDGPDYDGDSCHPATVLDVLAGRAESSQGPVVHTGDGSCVLVGLYSHGWSHESVPDDEAERRARIEATIACDLCGKPHRTEADRLACPEHSSLTTREWYMHMEHEVPETRREAAGYGAVCTGGHEHPYSLLYSTQLIQAFSSMFQAAPHRPVLMLHNYCGSGGMLKWMRRESYRKRTPLSSWPLVMMTAAGELEGAIPGLMPIYCRLLAQWLQEQSESKRKSVAAFFDDVQQQYLLENPALRPPPATAAVRCLLCPFNGREDTRSLCSVCFKDFEAKAPEERPDLDAIKAERIKEGQDSCEKQDARQEPAFCKFDIEYGDNSIADVQLSELFDNCVSSF